ncbi:LysR family transcriptional regulator [Alteromonas sp. a30]|uniref:LysR family transcriptional regulator n=1 Tax=Alteromonas sp. a30 TaxID=2730917 RepID=UPI00227F1010|nr:LysR family transcriptional regulator [Alteromonas sp. a30]MCY7297095.1 LysR family transcriptional regulator [Alteromonas sp. a30]
MYHVNDLTSFVAVIETGGIIAAAKQLDIPTATLSHRITKLEKITGTSLFFRSNKGVRLTPEGQTFYEKLLPILDAITDLNDSLSPHPHSLQGKLRITIPPWVLNLFILPNLASFQAQHPKLQLEFIATGHQRDISDEGIDLAIRVGKLPDSRLLARKIIDDKRILCASPAYLAEFGEPQTIDELKHHRSVCLPWLKQWHCLDEQHQRVTLNHSQSMLLSNAECLSAAIKQGLGIGMRSQLAVHACIQKGELVEILPNRLVDNESPLWCIRPNSRLPSQKADLFYRFCKEVILFQK